MVVNTGHHMAPSFQWRQIEHLSPRVMPKLTSNVELNVSFYCGFGITWKCLLQNKARKRQKALESLLGLIQKFPHEEPQYLQEDMEKVRAKFRQVCSLLNVPTDFSDYVKTRGNWQP